MKIFNLNRKDLILFYKNNNIIYIKEDNILYKVIYKIDNIYQCILK